MRSGAGHARRRVLRVGLAGGAALLGAGCGRRATDELNFWAMGSEAAVLGQLLPEFHARHQGVRVRVQQLPFSAAHEKLLTAFAGGSLPDLCQLGNTWLPEFAALDALEPLDGRVAAANVPLDDYFPGVLATSRLPGRGLLGLPWYVDTRLLFYRADLLREAGVAEPPRDWAAWRRAMAAVARPGRFGVLLPLNEPDPLFALALQQGDVLRDDATRGAFSQPPFRRALDFYAGLFRDGLAPVMGGAQIANVWDEFGRGLFAFYVTGPWNIGEFRRRLPAALQHAWATAPLPAPSGPGVSSAGGSSLVVFRSSLRKDAAWALIAYLSEPATMQRFHALTGDLPPRRSAWAAPALRDDPPSRAFAEQLERLAPAPQIPEWERVFQEMQAAAERVVRGVETADIATAALDRSVDAMLEKRRWLRARAAR